MSEANIVSVWRGSHFANVAADSDEGKAAIAAAQFKAAAPSVIEVPTATPQVDIIKIVSAVVEEKFKDLRAEWVEAVAGAKEEIANIVGAARSEIDAAQKQLHDAVGKAAAPAPPAEDAAGASAVDADALEQAKS